MKTKKWLCVIITLAMVVGLLQGLSLTAFAETGVTEYYCLDVGEGAYIDTNYTPNSTTRVVFDAEVSDCLTGAVLFGVDFHANDANYSFYVNAGHNYDVGKNVYGSGWGPGDDWGWHTAPFLPGRQIVELSPGQFKLGDTVYKTYNYVDFVSPGLPMYLFAINFFGGEINTFANQYIRFYSCKIYENDVLIHEFVPAKSGDEFGVCDKQDNNKFYKNQGDGHMVGYKKVNAGSTLPSGISNEGVILDFDGTITVSEDTTIKAPSGQSAILIASGRNVTIDIKEGKTLTVKGGNAIGRFGGGAGIEVPENSSLTIIGKGKLKASGGSASAGEKGADGENGRAFYHDSAHGTSWCYSGAGGRGGNGGGGAGAGIGGKGGYGGLGGNGGGGIDNYVTNGSTIIHSGISGSNGSNGTAGTGCGNLYIYPEITVDALRGQASLIPTSGGAYGKNASDFVLYDKFTGYGGGGGGAGGNGYYSADIGSGGGGGGGGAGGGSGIIAVKSDAQNGGGYGGEGGKGAVQGRKGSDDGEEIYIGSATAGLGGIGGESGGSSAPKTPTYLKVAAIPGAQSLTYNGNEQTVVPEGEGYTVSGNTGTNVGNYTATAYLKGGYCWSDGTVEDKTFNWSIEKRTLQAPETVNLHYTGYARTAIPDNSPDYKVYDGMATEAREEKYTARLVLNNFSNNKWNNSENDTTYVDYYIHKYADSDGKDGCDICHGTDRYLFDIDFLDREVNEDNTVITKPSTCVAARVISEGDTLWGDETTTEKVWYVVDDNITLNKRPTVKGNVGIILMNNTELKANNGITVEEGNSISFYAQTDENKIGKLTATTNGVSTIGGNGENTGEVYFYGGIILLNNTGEFCIGGNGRSVKGVYFYGGNISLKSTGVCIGGGAGGGSGGNVDKVLFYGGDNSLESTGACICGGNGGNGADGFSGNSVASSRSGGHGGNGGNVNGCIFYGGNNLLKSSNAACILGGNGGNGGSLFIGANLVANPLIYFLSPGNGADGGSINVNFYGGYTLLESTNTPCIVVGTGGRGGDTNKPSPGKSGSPGRLSWNVSGEPVIKTGDNADNAGDFTKYENQKYLSVKYHKWEHYSLTTHKCCICGEEAEHIDDGNGICTICGNKIIEIIGKEAATCEKSGHLAYYPFNGNYYSDQDYTAQITDLTKWLNTNVEDGGGLIPAKGHTWKCGTGEDYQYHICEACGRKEMHTYGYGNECTVCDTLNIVNMGSKVISENDIICYGDQKKWRVLSKNGNTLDSDGTTVSFSDGTKQVSKDNALFVISENDFGYRAFNSNGNQNWQSSDAQKWCNEGGFYTDAGITTAEQNAILTTSKSDAAYSGFKAADNILNDKVFYLSANEAATYFNDAANRQLKPDGSNESVRWWLRSPDCDVDDDKVGMVSAKGVIIDNFAINSGVPRPVFNLNAESVLFTSAAGFTSEGIANEWKLTLLDENRAFAIDNVTRSRNILKVAYTGAKTGDNETISYVITDNTQNVIKYYISQAVTDADGSIEITLPAMAAGDRLFVFNEQFNGAKKTNYASALQEVTIPEENSLTVDITGNTFTVNATGPDKGTGTVIVALYDSIDKNKLLNVKCYDLKTQTPENIDFGDKSGYVRAMWWSSLDGIMPLCDAKGENMEVEAE